MCGGEMEGGGKRMREAHGEILDSCKIIFRKGVLWAHLFLFNNKNQYVNARDSIYLFSLD